MHSTNRPQTRLPLTALAVLSFTTVASAHPGHGAHGFASGLAHPVTGLDHLLAMIAVGVLAVALKRAWVWALPLTFVGMMVLGAAAGVGGLFVPSWLAETMIALSVVVFGMLVAIGTRVPAFVVAPLVALFAVCHGSAHAAEMPEGGSIAAYFGGFVLGTIALHAVGIGVGLAIGRSSQTLLVRGAGVAMSLCGALMLVGIL